MRFVNPQYESAHLKQGVHKGCSRFAADIAASLKADPAPYSKQSRRELGEVEMLYLVELPKKRFDAYKGDSAFADRKLIVHYETNRYSVNTAIPNKGRKRIISCCLCG